MKILHLYDQLMNLYGDRGNVQMLVRALEGQGEAVELCRAAPEDELDFSGVDFLYLGAGTERSRAAALEHLLPYAGALRQAIDGGLCALFTGSAAAMAGRELVNDAGEARPALGLLDFTVRERRDVRYTGDAIVRHRELDLPLVGFVNKCDDWAGEVPALFQVELGRGNAGPGGEEGFQSGRLLGTCLTGPVLVKNPHFLRWLLALLLGREPEGQPDETAVQAHAVTLAALRARG